MNHLTNLYKHKCEQLEEQIYNMKKMLSEAQGTRDPTVIYKPRKSENIENVQSTTPPSNPYWETPPSPPGTIKPPMPVVPVPYTSPVPQNIPGYFPPISPYREIDRNPVRPQPKPKPTTPRLPTTPSGVVDSAIEYLQQGLQTFGPEYVR
jgi:hypothetical protein